MKKQTIFIFNILKNLFIIFRYLYSFLISDIFSILCSIQFELFKKWQIIEVIIFDDKVINNVIIKSILPLL